MTEIHTERERPSLEEMRNMRLDDFIAACLEGREGFPELEGTGIRNALFRVEKAFLAVNGFKLERGSRFLTVGQFLEYFSARNGQIDSKLFKGRYNPIIKGRKVTGFGTKVIALLMDLFKNAGLIEIDPQKTGPGIIWDSLLGDLRESLIGSVDIALKGIGLNLIGPGLRVEGKGSTVNQFRERFTDEEGRFDREAFKGKLYEAMDKVVGNVEETLKNVNYIDDDGKWRY